MLDIMSIDSSRHGSTQCVLRTLRERWKAYISHKVCVKTQIMRPPGQEMNRSLQPSCDAKKAAEPCAEASEPHNFSTFEFPSVHLSV